MNKDLSKALWMLAMYYVFFTLGYLSGVEWGNVTDFLMCTGLFVIGFVGGFFVKK